jgi:hypothetical protein
LREDTCANCGARIYLVKTGEMAFRWVTDPDKPDTQSCDGDPSNPFQRRDGVEHHHAPVSMRSAHR